MQPLSKVWRGVLLGVGVVAAGLGAVGAFEFQSKLEGSINYLVIAAPLVAVAAALIPCFAEELWRAGHRLKALAWGLCLIPAALTVFLSVAERVHYSKAQSAAERAAQHSAVGRAQQALEEAKSYRKTVDEDASKQRKLRRCREECRAKIDDAVAKASQRVTEAEEALKAAEGKAVQEAPLSAPAWLLPASLDLIAFLAIWSGLAPGHLPKAKEEPKAKVKAKRKAKRKPRPGKPSNDNDRQLKLVH